MSLSQRILLGLIAGVAVGVFFGERAAILDWPARAFVQLLGVTVLPYLVTSLIAGIARGAPDQGRRLLSRAGLALLLLWAVSLALVFVSSLVLPPQKGGSSYATVPAAAEVPIDWLELYIPGNAFRSLANNVVPAVVVFSALLGVALRGLEDKAVIIAALDRVSELLGRAGVPQRRGRRRACERAVRRSARLLDQGRRHSHRAGAAVVDRRQPPRLVEREMNASWNFDLTRILIVRYSS